MRGCERGERAGRAPRRSPHLRLPLLMLMPLVHDRRGGLRIERDRGVGRRTLAVSRRAVLRERHEPPQLFLGVFLDVCLVLQRSGADVNGMCGAGWKDGRGVPG